MKFLAKDFQDRVSLDLEVKNTALIPENFTIEGTKEELKRLFLSMDTKVWGVKCIQTDRKAQAPPKEKVFRGEPAPFGIIGQPIKKNG